MPKSATWCFCLLSRSPDRLPFCVVSVDLTVPRRECESVAHAVENLALLRRLTLSLLLAHPAKLSVAKKRFAAALDTEFLEEILNARGILENQ